MFELAIIDALHKNDTSAVVQFQQQLNKGCYYATFDEAKHQYSMLKILKKDKYGVHLRLYSNTYSSLPSSLDTSSLYIAGIDDMAENETLGIGHIPISYESFITWHIIDLNQCYPVKNSELEGYRLWQQAEGGYF